MCNNSRDPTLARWAKAHNFKVQRPSTPTFANRGGVSRIDLCFVREPFPPVVELYNFNEHSDHAPVKAYIVDRSIDEFPRIPWLYSVYLN